MLERNGQYSSDGDFIDITATGVADKLYSKSPFNAIPKKLTKQERTNLLTRLDELNADTTGETDTEKQEIRKKLDGEETVKLANTVALFEKGFHWNDGGLTPAGVKLLGLIKDWPGAIVVRRHKGKTSGHTELLLHMSSSGAIYTIGGNTGLADSDGNGSEYGFKKYASISEFCSKGTYSKFYVIKRGTKAPYTNGIGVSVKKTETYNRYVSELDKKNPELNTSTFNILRTIMET